jgi:hypothetical protein
VKVSLLSTSVPLQPEQAVEVDVEGINPRQLWMVAAVKDSSGDLLAYFYRNRGPYLSGSQRAGFVSVSSPYCEEAGEIMFNGQPCFARKIRHKLSLSTGNDPPLVLQEFETGRLRIEELEYYAAFSRASEYRDPVLSCPPQHSPPEGLFLDFSLQRL